MDFQVKYKKETELWGLINSNGEALLEDRNRSAVTYFARELAKFSRPSRYMEYDEEGLLFREDWYEE